VDASSRVVSLVWRVVLKELIESGQEAGLCTVDQESCVLSQLMVVGTGKLVDETISVLGDQGDRRKLVDFQSRSKD